MFYRRKFYIVKKEFVEIFNAHFNNTNLPNQLKYDACLIGRWMKDNTVEIFAIWEYDSYEEYIEVESKVRVTRLASNEFRTGIRKMVGKNMCMRIIF